VKEVDRLGLRSPAAADEAGIERDRDELERKFAVLRPEVFETLRKVGCVYVVITHAPYNR
jgi:hypothetical protein